MPQNSEDRPLARGLGRAAGRAAQSFRESQRADDARLRAERERLAAADEERLERRRADRERGLAERDEAEADAGLVHPLLKLARVYWLVVTAVLAVVAGAFVWNGLRARKSGEPVVDPLTGIESVGVLGGATGQFTMGVAVALLAAAALWGWIGLLRRRRSAIGTLTFIALLLAAPAFLRANGLLILFAVVMLVGVALLWLPPVRSRLRR